MQGHLKIYVDIQGVMAQHTFSDKKPTKHDFEASFEAKIYDREDGTTFLPNRVYLLITQMVK
jgi:hypothetical protein